MPITGKFVADFEDFDRGVQSAGAKLLTFEQASERAGGRLMDLGKAGAGAAPQFGTLTSSLRSFDGALSAAGLNISPQIRAIEEIGNASGKSALGLGKVATAGLALGVGMAAWGIGRAAMDFFQLDGAVQKAWQSLLGFGDAAAEAGAAKADALALATKHAGREITSLTEAIAINKAAADAQSLAWGRSTSAAHDSRVAVAAWQKEIRTVRSNGDIEQLTKDLASQDFTLKELSVKYGISVQALGYFTKAQKDSAAEVKAATIAHEAMAKSVRDYYNWVGERAIEHEKTVTESLAREAAAYRAFTNEMGVRRMEDDARAMESAKARQAAEEGAGQAAMDAAIKDEQLRNAAQGVNTELAKTPAVAGAAGASVISAGAGAQQASQGFLAMSEGLYSAIRAAQAADAVFGQATSAGPLGWNPVTGYGHRAAGGPVSAGQTYMVGERGPELFRPSSAGSIIPNGGGGITIVVQGSVLSTKAELARLVKEALANTHMAGGGRMPA